MRFGEKAKDYDRGARIQATTSRWLSEWLEPSGAGLDAIEFGAGTGGFTRYLASLDFNQLVASDISSRMVGVGRTACPLASWRVEDAWRPQPASVDRIYSSNLLQWCEDPVETLRRWKGLLKPKGRLLASVFVEGSLREFGAIDPRFYAFPWRAVEEWIQSFEEAGWKVARWSAREDCENHPNARLALRSLHALGAVGEPRMSYSELNRFLKRCDSGVVEGFPLSWNSLRIECAVT